MAVVHLTNRGARAGAASQEHGVCHVCTFKPRCLPAELEDERLTSFERAIKRQARPLKAGQILVREGDPVLSLFALRVGSLKALIGASNGSERVAGFRFPGAVIGLAEPEQETWARTFVALEDAWLCRIPVNVLDETLNRQLVRLMSERLRQEYDYHLELAFKTSAEKIASFLLQISENHRQRNLSATRFYLPMSNIDIASYLGMRHESLSRTFALLQQRGLVERRGKQVWISNLAALRIFQDQ